MHCCFLLSMVLLSTVSNMCGQPCFKNSNRNVIEAIHVLNFFMALTVVTSVRIGDLKLLSVLFVQSTNTVDQPSCYHNDCYGIRVQVFQTHLIS